MSKKPVTMPLETIEIPNPAYTEGSQEPMVLTVPLSMQDVPMGRRVYLKSTDDERILKGEERHLQLWFETHDNYYWRWEEIKETHDKGFKFDGPNVSLNTFEEKRKVAMLVLEPFDPKNKAMVRRRSRGR